jgi:two-component system, NarL family, sensor histidine kinase DevS
MEPRDSILNLAKGALEQDLEVVLNRVLESARKLTGARYAALCVLNDARMGLDRFVTAGIGDDARARIGVLPRGRGVLGDLILDPVPVRLVDVGEHPHSYGFPRGHPPMHSFLGVPILVGATPLGSIYLTEKAGRRPFTEADEQSLVSLAGCAARAIEHARHSAQRDVRNAREWVGDPLHDVATETGER